MRIRMSCPGRSLRGCRVGDVQRAVVHVLVVVVRLSCVALSVEPVKRDALKIRAVRRRSHVLGRAQSLGTS